MNDTGDAFTLQMMLDLRAAAEQADDDERERFLAAFSAYADAFVAHVPHDDGEAVESLLLARYFSFLPLVPADSAGGIRTDLEAALMHLTTGATSAEVVDALWRAHGTIEECAAQGGFEANDVPIRTVVANVLTWARGALSA